MSVSILLVLASVTMPLAKVTGKRTEELELHQRLREIRMAIDEFRKDWARDGEVLIGPLCLKNKLTCKDVTGVTGYPRTLEVLLGVTLSGAEASAKETRSVRRYLRRVPMDPLTGSDQWNLRCYQDPPGGLEWCGQDVFDVSSKSPGEAIDGTRYQDW